MPNSSHPKPHRCNAFQIIPALTLLCTVLVSSPPAAAQDGSEQRSNTRETTVFRTSNVRAVLRRAETLLYIRSEKNRFIDWSHEDAFAWLRSWNRERVIFVAGAAAALAGISIIDQDITDQATKWDSGILGTFLDAANSLGKPEGALIPVGLFAASFAVDDTKFEDAAFTSLQSYMASNALVLLTKFVVGRSRPDQGKGSSDVHPLSGATSFPSGHTSSIFAIVMPWVFYYPGPLTYSLVAVATGTTIARVQRQKHWLSDVLAGAAISTTMSHFLYSRHRDKQNLKMNFDPVGSRISLSFRIGS